MASKEKLIAAAQKFLAKGQLPKAISEYQKLVQAFPKDVRNRQKLAELLSREKRTDESITEYSIVAKSYAETGFYLKAIAVYKQMQKIDPSCVEFYTKLAELNEKQGLIGNALSEYRSLVTFYEQKNLIDDAISVLEKMLQLDSGNLNIRAKVAECLFVSNRNAEAAEHLLGLVDELQDKQEFSKIIKLYERLQDACPDEVEVKLPLADALLASGQAEKAVPLLKKLLKNSPENQTVLRALADGYLALEDAENAKLTCSHLLRLAPDDLDCREKLIRAFLVAQEPERALQDLETWKEEFLQAGRVAVVQELYELAGQKLPDESLADATLSSLPELNRPSDQAEDIPSGNQDAENIDHTANAALAEEGMAETASPDPVGEEMNWSDQDHGQPGEADAQDVDLDLELDLDLDLDLEEDAAEDAAEEVELEIDLDLGMLETFGPAEELDDSAHSDEHGSEQSPGQGTGQPAASEPTGLEQIDQSPMSFEPEVADPVDEVIDFLETGELADLEELEPAEDPALVDRLAEPGDQLEVEESEWPDEVETPAQPEELVEHAGLEELEELIELEEGDLPLEVGLSAEVDGENSALPDDAELHTQLEEVEFYLQQDLCDEAGKVVASLVASYGERPELTEMLSRLEERRLAAQAEEETVDFNDLMSDVNDDELFGAADLLGEGGDEGDTGEFTQKLPSDLDTEDTESHYNLGIAYKEMGLYDDALAEFDKAIKDPLRQLDCLTLKGQCALEMGDFDLAESTFKQALGVEGLGKEERVPLHYELGLFYQSAGRLLEALENFQVVADHDLFFREVGEIIKKLRKQLGLDDDQDDGGAQGSRDKVSYL